MVRDPDAKTRHVLDLRYALEGLQVLLLIVLLAGACLLAFRESQGATQISGTLVSVDHSDGGDGGTGLSTVRYTNAAGATVTTQVVIDLSSLQSQDPGASVELFVRDGQAVDEPQPRLASLLLRIVQALIIWAVLSVILRYWFRQHDKNSH